MSCPGKDPTIDAALVDLLQKLRDHAGASVTVNSGWRCEDYNRSVGGASNSQHLRGRAADVKVANMSPKEVADFFEALNVPGLGRYSTFTHVDTRKGHSRWGSN